MPECVIMCASSVPCDADGDTMDWSPCGRYIMQGKAVSGTAGLEYSGPAVEVIEVARAIRMVRETRSRLVTWQECVVASRTVNSSE